MVERFLKQVLSMLIFMCVLHAGHAAEHALKANPFVRPVDVQDQARPSEPVVQEPPVPFVLRGTMVAGQQSLANISGVIVPLGEEINGYRLVGVQEREIILLKGNDRRILSVDVDKEGVQ